MSSLIFHTLDAYVREEYGRPSTELFRLLGGPERPSDAPDRRSSITIHLTLDPESRLKLATGEDLRHTKGHLTLQPSDEPRPIASEDKSKNQIGYMHFEEEYRDGTFHMESHYQLWALIPRPQFDYLATILRESRMPISTFVDVEGLTHPDEFSAQWDNKTKTNLPLTSIKFAVRAAHFPAINWDDGNEVGLLMPVTRADLRSALQTALVLNQKLNTKLGFILAALVVLIIGLLLRYW